MNGFEIEINPLFYLALTILIPIESTIYYKIKNKNVGFLTLLYAIIPTFL